MRVWTRVIILFDTDFRGVTSLVYFGTHICCALDKTQRINNVNNLSLFIIL
ncbi:hypothetical protein HanIR_Chr11g0559941 [Helianthus annuus]|nr:hypothetical protein HanIR_Chr11g0559941 [Helianthus annuus]